MTPDLDEIVRASGIPLPNGVPYTHITFACVVWQDAERVGRLLERVKPYFERLAVGVQSSTDGTLDVVRRYTDFVAIDEHRGYGDATFGPRILPMVRSHWTFKLDADEWPDDDLLTSLSSATWYAENHGFDALWIPFRSWIEGVEWKEPHAHPRLFETRLGWPSTLHSTPPFRSSGEWSTGHIEHRRSLDEMMRDYLSYLVIGRNNHGWDTHNRMMIREACKGAAETYGWGFVHSFEWWPKVQAEVFKEEQPWSQLSMPGLAATPSMPSQRRSQSR